MRVIWEIGEEEIIDLLKRKLKSADYRAVDWQIAEVDGEVKAQIITEKPNLPL